ncbi:MAG: diguanylate cyclase [Alphaproteobacteria bacterium]|nr:diguanylate cyclase [Alphaproteobacteria bacterium]
MASFLIPETLSQIVDNHIKWFVEWHRAAFVDPLLRSDILRAAPVSDEFGLGQESSSASLPIDQPEVDRLATLHAQLHKLARLVLIKASDETPISSADYLAVSSKYSEFMRGVLRLERAFAVAASGLDSLTGLRSRVGMYEDLIGERERFLRTGKDFCVAIMDIDYFKRVNDNYGHDAGDRVLASVADHVSSSLRGFDDVFRMGGEEFLICLKEADISVGSRVLERLCKSLSAFNIKLSDDQQVCVTASFGLTSVTADADIEEILRRADQALYRAKNAGRNQVVVWKAEDR